MYRQFFEKSFVSFVEDVVRNIVLTVRDSRFASELYPKFVILASCKSGVSLCSVLRLFSCFFSIILKIGFQLLVMRLVSIGYFLLN